MRWKNSVSIPALAPAFALLAGMIPGSALAQGMDEVQFRTEQVREGLYMLDSGIAGNIGVSAGEDGVFLIDDQFAPLTPKVIAAIREVTDAPIRYLINTHYHADHTGGNENLGKEGALIFAHDNIRARLEAAPPVNDRAWTNGTDGLPVITFNSEMSFHLNGGEARAIHVANAHTDGDAIIHFRDLNAIHMGDLMFNGLFPYIDVDAGGNVDGVLKGVALALELADDETRIIPGHGPVASKADLIAYRDMIQTVRDRVAKLVKKGAYKKPKNLAQVLEAGTTAEYDEAWTWGFINSEKFVTSIYRSLTGKDE